MFGFCGEGGGEGASSGGEDGEVGGGECFLIFLFLCMCLIDGYADDGGVAGLSGDERWEVDWTRGY